MPQTQLRKITARETIYKYLPKTSSGGQFFGASRYQKAGGEKENLRQKKADRRKKKKLGDMTNPTFLVGFFLGHF